MTITLTLRLPPSKNAEPNTRHWSVQRLYKLDWATEAWGAWAQAGRPTFRRVRITPVFYVKRRRDPDNLLGMWFKAVMDGLKGRLVADDWVAYVELAACDQRLDRVNPRVELICEEVNHG